MRGCRCGDEYGREHGEDECLDEADEELHDEKRERDEIGRQKGGDNKENLPGEYVAEEAERKRDHSRELGDEFEDADPEKDRIFEVKESFCVRRRADGRDTEEMRGDNGDNRDSEGKVKIRAGRPQEWHGVPIVGDEERTDARQESRPVGDSDKGEDAGDQREISFGALATAEDGLQKSETSLDH